MEQTLGKRIAEHRKRLGMTQDALAEQLGITAQAVSKWENDQSCPDIAMLPRLAEIFGISTDELLGREAPRPVHTAEVINDDESGGNRFQVKDGKWEMHWDSGRRSAIGFACWVLVMGLLLFADNFYNLEVGFWNLAWPSFLLMLGLFTGKKFSFTHLGFILLGGYFLVHNLDIISFELGGEIIWPALVVLFGLSLLADALRKPKKPRFRVVKNGESKTKCGNHDDCFHCDVSFGEANHLVDLSMLKNGMANVSFGELVIDLSQVQALSPCCVVDIKCSFGEVRLLVPRQFRVETHNSTAFGNVCIQGHPDPDPVGLISVNANVSFGEITVQYV